MKDIRAHITSHRDDFNDESLNGTVLSSDPLKQFEKWLEEAIENEVNEAYALSLSTVGQDGFPSTRIVFLRGISNGGLIFYTNYGSLKGRELAAEDRALMNFFWPELQRQVRVKGLVSKISPEQSDDYFASRPRNSQLGAWASKQSQPLDSRETLENRVKELEMEYEGRVIPRPENWGGYVLIPVEWEFWKGRSSRLHDRFTYTQKGEDWMITRLYP
ncbi:MAG: pyridoxamine 5'-phosphate oxidase [Flavobacteriales bacterium]|nr:pyridoxamine 5'-phosphate oxidase [Flavobacteriales bacterium]